MNERAGEWTPGNGMPEVSRETLASALASMGEGEYYAQAGARLEGEQPALNDHLNSFLQSYAKTPDEFHKMAEVALFMYDVLSRQSDADAMNRRFDVDLEQDEK